MDADGTSHLGEPRDRFLDLFATDHHQIGELVDDDYDVRQDAMRIAVVVPLLQLVAAFCLDVITGDVSHAVTREVLVTAFHLGDCPFERNGSTFWVGDDRRREMRDVGVQPELKPLWVDHDKFHFVGPCFIKDRHHERVDADRFTGTGCTRDQQMRHLGEIGDVIYTIDRLTKCER